jgi:hypothetical protein
VVLNEEAREFKWVSLAAAKKLRLNQPTRILIAAVEKLLRRKRAGGKGR